MQIDRLEEKNSMPKIHWREAESYLSDRNGDEIQGKCVNWCYLTAIACVLPGLPASQMSVLPECYLL